ncbi:MAG: VIT domain-containing protein, partial [Gammaproteobacteria bacterium]
MQSVHRVLFPIVLRAWRARLLSALLVAATPALADPPVAALADLARGALLVGSPAAGAPHEAPLVDTAVSMAVSGLIARVRVTHTFMHTGADWVNGIYAFPLPERAAVDQLAMTVGERRIEGRIEPRAAARARYERAREQGHKASLVEQQRANLFTTSVANIGPGERVEVTIEYQQTVAVDSTGFSLRFPLTSGVRYIPGRPIVDGFDGGGWARNTDQVPDASQVTPPVTPAGVGHDNPVSIEVILDAGLELATIESPWHAITSAPRGDGAYTV